MERTLPSLTVLVPVYNSEGSLRPLVERLEPVLARLASEYELILVNDASRDGSWAVVQELARAKPWIRGICMMRNYGQHNALLCGIRAARYEIVATMDDDLQHPPEELEKLLVALDANTDVVYGTPQAERHGFLRDLASRVTKLALEKSMGAETASKVSAFRVFRADLRKAFENYQSQFVSIDVLLTWGTTRFRAVQVRHDPRTIGVSNYTFKKLLTHALNMMTGFSTLPLQLASWIGFVLSAVGIALVVFLVVLRVFTEHPVEGFTFIASLITIFSGAQLFALGIIGEYLARMHFRMMDRPTYAVRAEVGSGAKDAQRTS
ncbi:MAG: glycosyltransferase family 2 protein [Planctomycetes bacterium]|nr:glycosyltransferase family 2 protein [Planctomycetota bacterium]